MGHPAPASVATADDGPRSSTAASARAGQLERMRSRNVTTIAITTTPARTTETRSRQRRRRAMVTNAKSIDCGSCGGGVNLLIVDGSRGNLESHAAGVEVAAFGALVVRLHRQHPHAPAARRAHGAIDVGVDRACGRRHTPRLIRRRGLAARRTWRIVVHRVPVHLMAGAGEEGVKPWHHHPTAALSAAGRPRSLSVIATAPSEATPDPQSRGCGSSTRTTPPVWRARSTASAAELVRRRRSPRASRRRCWC